MLCRSCRWLAGPGARPGPGRQETLALVETSAGSVLDACRLLARGRSSFGAAPLPRSRRRRTGAPGLPLNPRSQRDANSARRAGSSRTRMLRPFPVEDGHRLPAVSRSGPPAGRLPPAVRGLPRRSPVDLARNCRIWELAAASDPGPHRQADRILTALAARSGPELVAVVLTGRLNEAHVACRRRILRTANPPDAPVARSTAPKPQTAGRADGVVRIPGGAG